MYRLFIISLILVLNINTLTDSAHNIQSHEDNLDKAKINKSENYSDNVPAVVHVEKAGCGTAGPCAQLPALCFNCTFNYTCVYGQLTEVNCTVSEAEGPFCIGERDFTKKFICQYCYQSDPSLHTCVQGHKCKAVHSPREYYRSNCTMNDDVVCLGQRTFPKRLLCNWTQGYRWSTALLLSITLGGFGADRFYLGHWQEGIGKLFSFGGLGVWTLIDVILIALRYLGPADGSLYI